MTLKLNQNIEKNFKHEFFVLRISHSLNANQLAADIDVWMPK